MSRRAARWFSAAILGALLPLGFFASSGLLAGAATADQVTLRLWPAGQGRIDVAQGGSTIGHCDIADVLNNEVPCQVSVATGQPVTLTAVAEPNATIPVGSLPPGWPVPNPAFVHWSRAGCPGTAPCVFTPDASDDSDWIGAIFTPLDLEVGINGAGSVTAAGPQGAIKLTALESPTFGEQTLAAIVPADQEVVLTATPKNLGDLNLWGEGCAEGDNDTGPTCTVAMTNVRTFAGVAFGRPPPALEPPGFPFKITARITVKRRGSGQGTVTGSGINCGSTCVVDLDYQARVTLRADAASGSAFARWDPVCATDATCKFSAGSASFVEAYFNGSTTSTTTSTTTTTATTTTTKSTTSTRETTTSAATTSTRSTTTTSTRTASFTARVAKISAEGHALGRRLSLVLVVNRRAQLTARLTRRSETVLYRRMTLHQGKNAVRIRIPRAVRPGVYKLALRLAAGNVARTTTTSVKIPR